MEYMRYKHFSKTDRLELSILLKKGYSLREIGRALKKDPSSVSREIKENSVNGEYDPHKAHHKAYVKRKYSKYQGMRIRENPELKRYLEEKIKSGWSPEQVAGRWNLETGDKLHHKTIYKYLYSAYGQYLCRYLYSKSYRKKRRRKKKSPRVLIPNRIFIDQRPEVANLRLQFGHYEGDTMGRSKSASPETLVVVRERLSRKLFAIKVPQLKWTVDGLKYILNSLPVVSLTLDNGVENVHYQELRVLTFFCHPYSSWEKGSIEQGIKLFRRYIPRRADLKDYSLKDISAILERINNTPLKCLGWRTPNEVFEEQGRINYQLTMSECCTSG
ncbi:MAG: IS30 family transposase [Patescibacteria group bacterium]|nr:IS30 family transposase [Patescibacteria group bacterium]